MTKAVLGIIGGSGIYDLPGIEDVTERRVTTPWGEPSDVLRVGRVGATQVVFLPRHGRGHRIPPGEINYRANIDALKQLGVTDLASLAGHTVCAPKGTSSLKNLETMAPAATPVPADNHTGCLVKFQQGQADAITGDDTVLAGLAAQDPYAVVTDAPAITDEPYGLGVNLDNVYFVRYINAVLAQVRSDGEWKQIYNTWLASRLGKAPNPPTPNYGRG